MTATRKVLCRNSLQCGTGRLSRRCYECWESEASIQFTASAFLCAPFAYIWKGGRRAAIRCAWHGGQLSGTKLPFAEGNAMTASNARTETVSLMLLTYHL
jgi:hypothetical protein